MATDHENEGQESGSALRQKLELALTRERAARKVAADAVVAQFKGVTVEDLHEVDPEEFATKAAEIAEARAAERQRILREALSEAGLPTDELDTAISRLRSAPQGDDGGHETAADRVNALGALGGMVPTKSEPQLWGEDRIRAAVAAAQAKR